MKTKKISGILIALVIGILILPTTAGAVTVSPPILELEDVNRGDILEQSLKVRNEGDADVTYYLQAENFIAAGETGAPEFVGYEEYGLSGWVKFPYANLTIPANETVTVNYQIIVPGNASPGSHYAAVFLSTLPPDTEGKGSQVSIAQKIGSLIFVRIAGDAKEGAKVVEFSTESDSYDSLPVDFTTRIENTGNVHLKPTGEILIKNMMGSLSGRLPVNEKEGAVLSNHIRKFDSTWVKNPNAVGSKTFWGKYRNQKENYAFGKYTAELRMQYGEGNKRLKAMTEFLVIPWHVILVNVVIVILVIIILYILVKKYNAWLLKKYAGRAPKAKASTKKKK